MLNDNFFTVYGACGRNSTYVHGASLFRVHIWHILFVPPTSSSHPEAPFLKHFVFYQTTHTIVST